MGEKPRRTSTIMVPLPSSQEQVISARLRPDATSAQLPYLCPTISGVPTLYSRPQGWGGSDAGGVGEEMPNNKCYRGRMFVVF